MIKKNIPYLVLSSLAITTVIAAPVPTFAADIQVQTPVDGIYVDGSTKTYYSVVDFAFLTKAQKQQILAADLDNIYIVLNSEITSFAAIMDEFAAGKTMNKAREDALKPYQSGDLEPGYKDIYGNEIVIPATISIDSISVIDATHIKLTFNQAATAVSVKVNGETPTGFAIELSQDKKSATITTSPLTNYTINREGEAILELITPNQVIVISVE